MESQEAEISDSTKEIYYDQISSVDYGGERLRIGSADGGTVKVVTSEKPVELIEEVDERVQEYKTRYAAESEASEEGASATGSEYGVGTEAESDSEAGLEPGAEVETEGFGSEKEGSRKEDAVGEGAGAPESKRKDDETGDGDENN